MLNNLFIQHITLTTGHARDSFFDEVTPQAVAYCCGLIENIAAGQVSYNNIQQQKYRITIPGERYESVQISNLPYFLSGCRYGKCFVSTVWRLGDDSPILTIGIAAHSRCGSRLWREMHKWGQAAVVTDPNRCPQEPWVASAFETRNISIEHLMMLADFERCLAWAFLELLDTEKKRRKGEES